MKKIIFILFLILLTACKTTTSENTTTTGGTTAGTTTAGTTTTTTTVATTTATTTIEITDEEIVADDKEALTLLGDLTNVTSNMILPVSGLNGSTITWQSSHADVITTGGIVTQPTTGDVTVTLTATITYNDASDTKEFTIIVKQLISDVCTEASENEILNPGFESGSLCGWTVTGDAFKDSYVLDISTFWTGGSYNKDGEYLFTSNDHEGETGTLTSTTFTLGGSGWISFKLGAAKNVNQLYVSIKDTQGTDDVSDDTEIARFGNTSFDDNLYTANLVQYKADLTAHLTKELYIQIVDEATSNWAWISMDSFHVYYENESELPQNAILASDLRPTEVDCSLVTAPSINDIINGGFDTGTLCGWTSTGEAFTASDLTKNSIEWFGERFYPDGDYFYSSWVNNNESKTGTLTSSNFTLGGTGFISFRLGGAKPKTNLDEAIYISVFKADGTEVARFMNSNFNNGPHIYSYKADLSSLIGEELYIKVVDNATGDWGNLFFDSFDTYYAEATDLPENATLATNLIAPVVETPEVPTTIENGGFETGDLSGWVATGDAFTVNGISNEGGFNSEGTYHFNTWKQGDNGGQGEGATGTLTSSLFKLSGSGFITFKFGGAKNSNELYVSVVTEAGDVIARYGNTLFNNNGDMNLYKADLSQYLGQNLYIKVVDNATSDWAFSMLDSFNTYYETESLIAEQATLATNLVSTN